MAHSMDRVVISPDICMGHFPLESMVHPPVDRTRPRLPAAASFMLEILVELETLPARTELEHLLGFIHTDLGFF